MYGQPVKDSHLLRLTADLSPVKLEALAVNLQRGGYARCLSITTVSALQTFLNGRWRVCDRDGWMDQSAANASEHSAHFHGSE